MIVSLAYARDNNMKYYFTGKPCKNGNVSQRLTSDRSCLCDVCRKIKSDKKLQWVKDNRIRHYATAKKWRDSDPQYYSNKQRQYYLENRENRLASNREYFKNNQEKFFVKNKNRRIIKKQATMKWDKEFTDFVLEQAYRLKNLREEITGFEWHVDHMIPLQADEVCGLHIWNNFQVIPAELNLSKNNKLILTQVGEWLR